MLVFRKVFSARLKFLLLCNCRVLVHTQLHGCLSGLSDAFKAFHSSGQEHLKAMNMIASQLREIASLKESRKENTIADPLHKVSPCAL